MSRAVKKIVGDLACGRWIQFETSADLSQEDPSTAGLYKKDRFFWVMSIECERIEGYHSNLFDIDGKHFSYNSRMRTVGGASRLRLDKVMLVEILHVVSVYGAEKTRMVYESALQYCEAMTQANSRALSCQWQKQLLTVFSNANTRHKAFTESELRKFNLFINTPVRAQILRWIVSNLSEQQVAAEKNLPAILREEILSFQRTR